MAGRRPGAAKPDLAQKNPGWALDKILSHRTPRLTTQLSIKACVFFRPLRRLFLPGISRCRKFIGHDLWSRLWCARGSCFSRSRSPARKPSCPCAGTRMRFAVANPLGFPSLSGLLNWGRIGRCQASRSRWLGRRAALSGERSRPMRRRLPRRQAEGDVSLVPVFSGAFARPLFGHRSGLGMRPAATRSSASARPPSGLRFPAKSCSQNRGEKISPDPP